MSRIFRVATLCLSGAVTGCASIPDDWGRSDVDFAVEKRGREIVSGANEKPTQALSKALDAEQAIRIALRNNPGIQAEYARLGFGAAEVYRASRISNPVFSFAALNPSNSGGDTRLSFGLVGSFTDLITLPQRKKLAKDAFAALKAEVGAKVLALAADTERAFIRYQAARQIQRLRDVTATAAQLSAELADRFHAAGNISPRQLAQARSAASQAKVIALTAAAEAFAARRGLATILGVSTGDAWQVVDQFPLPPSSHERVDALLAVANTSRLDLEAAKQRAVVTAERKNFTAWARWLGDFDIGVEKERESDGERLFGPTLQLEIPVFNQNRDLATAADAEMRIAYANLRRLAIEIENDVRLAHLNVRNSRQKVLEIGKTLIPMRVAATRQAQREQNYMLIGAFELIQSKQLEYDSYAAYIEAIRDYWLARTALTRAVGRTVPNQGTSAPKYIDAEQLMNAFQTDAGHKHEHHGIRPDAGVSK